MRTILVASALLAGACGGAKSSPPAAVSNSVPAPPPDAPPPSEAEQAVAAMQRFTDQMCACADAACAKRVSDDMVGWSQAMAKSAGPIELSEADTKRVTDLGMRMGECMQRTMSPPASSP